MSDLDELKKKMVDLTWSKWNQIKSELVAMYHTVIVASRVTVGGLHELV